MGFIDKFLSLFTEPETNSPLLPDNSVSASTSTDIGGKELADSLVLKLLNLKQKLTLIEQALPEKVDILKNQINDFENQIVASSDDATAMLDIEKKYLELEKQFNTLENLCEHYLIQRELQKLQHSLDTAFFGSFDTPSLLSENFVSDAEYLLNQLYVKKGKFEGEQLNLFISDLIKAEYRLKCCKMLEQIVINPTISSSSFQNLFKDISPIKHSIYGEFIKNDYYLAQETLNTLSKKYRFEHLTDAVQSNFDNYQFLIDNLDIKLSKDFISNFVVDSVFMDDKFVYDLIKLHHFLRDNTINFSKNVQDIKDEQVRKVKQQEQEEIEAANREKLEKENAEKAEKEKEFFKSATPKELATKLVQIDNSIFDIQNSYEEILKYEIQVAKARGLLSPINLLEVEDMETCRIPRSDIGIIVKKAKDLGINYRIFCDIDDCTTDNCLLTTVKDKADTLISLNYSSNSCSSYRKLGGTYSSAFSKYFLQETGKTNQIFFNNENSAYYLNDNATNHTLGQSQLLSVYEHIQELSKDPHVSDNITVSLEMSYLKPLVPILEALNKEGITYYIPPIDKRTEKHSDSKKIYINRSDLETYKEKVHPLVSSKELGDIIIGDENFNLTNEILAGCDIPFVEEQAKRKDLKQKYKTFTEQEMRSLIKSIDDDSIDVTDSYKDILTFEKDIARERGLLTPKNEMATNDISFMRIQHDDLWRLMQLAKNNGIRCSFLLDVDENTTKNILVAFSKDKKNELKLPNILSSYLPDTFAKMQGTYGNSFLKILEGKYNINKNYVTFYKNCIYTEYVSDADDLNSNIRKLYASVKSAPTTKEDIEDIKVPLTLSYLRPLVPILEKLKEAGIEYYIPPFDDSTNKYNPTKKIYIDRKDLDVYKEKVHPVISSSENGIVSIGYENITVPDIILDGCDIPFIRDGIEK